MIATNQNSGESGGVQRENQRRLRVLDIVRGLSAMAVVIYHATMHKTAITDFVHANPTGATGSEWLVYLAGRGFLGVPVFL
jgi:peptidoglycan/LPS O-acetylase OafA/YrhL